MASTTIQHLFARPVIEAYVQDVQLSIMKATARPWHDLPPLDVAHDSATAQGLQVPEVWQDRTLSDADARE